jgi:hypothetical protein
MIHPATELRYISQEIGFGVFATAFIPKGTIVYVHDDLEIEIAAASPKLTDPLYRPLIERYAHTDADGTRTISWDIARYINHCCQANTMSTGFDFEIAVRDIAPNEELTDEYGLFEFAKTMPLACAKTGCRGQLNPNDLECFGADWDSQVKEALVFVRQVEQPLWRLINAGILAKLQHYLQTGINYPSVLGLRPHKTN